MDTAAFIVVLLTFLAVLFWYVESEMKGSDGAHGLFAVRQAEKPRKARAARHAGGAPRYRPRAEPAPAAADGGIADGAAPKYRRKERAWDRAAARDEE